MTPHDVLDRLAAIVAATDDPWAERLHERLARILAEQARLETMKGAHLRVIREAAKLGRHRDDLEGPGADLWMDLARDLGEAVPVIHPKRKPVLQVAPPPQDGVEQAPRETPVAELNLAARTETLLRLAGYQNVGQLLHAGHEGLRRIRGMGRGRCNEVSAALYECGHNLPDWSSWARKGSA